MSAFSTLISLIADGMAVSASTANRPMQQLQGNVNYLKELIESALLGSTVYARERTVEIDAQVGQPVYYNGVTQRFERALASVVVTQQGFLATSPSSLFWGLVARKTSATKADILLSGVAEIDLSAAVTDPVTSGLQYLSTTTPGVLTAERPAVSVPVCMVAGLGQTAGTHEVFLRSDFRSLLDEHQHYRFELICELAAGSSEEGWLPAAHSVFDGKAPAGAVYGYNVSASGFAALWPPLPYNNAYLEWRRSLAVMGAGVPAGMVRFDNNGIWWLCDCEGQEPFDTETSSITPDCACITAMGMTLYFTKPVLWTDSTAVLSLTAREGSGLTIVCAETGAPASTGHLELQLDLDLALDEDDREGHLVVKTLENSKLHRGPVVEAMVAGSSNVTLTSSLGALPASGRAQGIVTVTVDSDVAGSIVPSQTVRLDGVTEEYYAEVIGLGFGAGQDTEFRGRLFVGSRTELPANTQMQIVFRFLGRTAGTVPGDTFSLTYRRVPAPSTLLTPAALPLVDTLGTLDTAVTLTSADQYFEAVSDAFDVAAGDVVMFTLRRDGEDSYSGDLLLLEHHGALINGT